MPSDSPAEPGLRPPVLMLEKSSEVPFCTVQRCSSQSFQERDDRQNPYEGAPLPGCLRREQPDKRSQ